MVVELGVAVVVVVVVVVEGGGVFIMDHMWVHGGEGGGLPWGGGVTMSFSLGMFFVVIVVVAVAVGGWGDLGFCFYLGFGYIILLHKNIILMRCIVK